MPSTWFQWHADLITAGMRVLDLACGSGGNAIAAAELGAKVVAVDRDPEQLKAAEEAAGKANVAVQFVAADLTSDPIPDGPYDVVMAFSYLDRERMPRFSYSRPSWSSSASWAGGRRRMITS
jgi:ribosomal protein L11 methylase PrmA